MLPFFRKLRKTLLAEKRETRYLLYALGEILLVGIGILPALQANNSNEARKIRSQEAGLRATGRNAKLPPPKLGIAPEAACLVGLARK